MTGHDLGSKRVYTLLLQLAGAVVLNGVLSETSCGTQKECQKCLILALRFTNSDDHHFDL